MESSHQFLVPIREGEGSAEGGQRVSGRELDALLNLLVRIRKRVALFGRRAGAQQHLSMVLGYRQESGWLLLDVTPDDRFNRQVESSGLSMVTQLDEGKIQVDFEDVTVEGEGAGATLRCRVPETILRVQCRQAHRVSAGSDIRFSFGPLVELGAAEARVVDLSDIGIRLLLAGEGVTPPAEGDLLEGCLLTLSGLGSITARVEVKGVYLHSAEGGGQEVEIGGHFVDLPASSHALLQRYIFHRDLEERGRQEELDNLEHSLVSSGEPVVRERL